MEKGLQSRGVFSGPTNKNIVNSLHGYGQNLVGQVETISRGHGEGLICPDRDHDGEEDSCFATHEIDDISSLGIISAQLQHLFNSRSSNQRVDTAPRKE